MTESIQKKVLVIDDDHSLLALMKKILGSKGHNILTADSGEHGLEVAFKERPDIILCDIMMPVSTGWNFVELARESSELRKSKIIIITNQDEKDVQEEMSKHIVQGFWKKDSGPDVITNMIQEILSI